ncbi:hypothetical protein [Erythrobacter oryzae]|uniref:hypothetical protein n=1 Tax=Erythrobacter oryzae TaxID=3019556 RepID=UPI00255656ED|nr:hypothetical protein [Erythrobacter sp. COR-2]
MGGSDWDRRSVLHGGMGVMGALATGGFAASPAQAADRMVPLAGMSAKNYFQTMAKVLARTDRIAVPSYRFGLVMRNGMGASGGSGTTKVDLTADLVGVDPAMMRQLAHLVFSDFIERLRATGRTVLGWNEISASEGFRKLEPTPAPFLKKPFADSRTVAVVSPEYLPLLTIGPEAPLSDRSPFNLKNARAINAMSAELKCLVMTPSLVLDFAALSGSGHSVYGDGANVDIKPGLFLVPLFTHFNFYHAKIALAGEGGRLILEDRVAVGQAGQLVQTSNFNNNAEIEEWNAYVRSNAWWTEPNMAAPSRPTLGYNYSTYQYRVDPPLLQAAVMDAARATHGLYMGVINANRPA